MKTIPIKNENVDLCSPCGGHCCKWSPGTYLPDQLIKSDKDIKTQFEELLKTDKHVFVRSEYIEDKTAFKPKYYTVWTMRPKTKNSCSQYEYDNLGTCLNLTSDGCSLTFEDRPLECQKLIPDAVKCQYPEEWDTEKDIVQKWLPYQGIILNMNEEYWDKVPVQKSA